MYALHYIEVGFEAAFPCFDVPNDGGPEVRNSALFAKSDRTSYHLLAAASLVQGKKLCFKLRTCRTCIFFSTAGTFP